MALTPQSCITEARGLLNDTVATYRYTDADMLQYFNDCLDEMAGVVAPHYFSAIGEMECVANQARQQVSFDDTLKLLEIVRIKNGNALTPADKASLDAFSPGWHAMTAAAAIHWMPDMTSPIRFYIYPPAPAGQFLEVRYTKVPAEFTINQDTGLPASLLSAIADYLCYRVSVREDEYAVQGKANTHYQSFSTKLGVGAAA